MFNFYLLPEAVRIILCMLSVFGVIAFALSFALGIHRLHSGGIMLFENLLVLLALCQVFAVSIMISQAQMNIADGVIAGSDYGILRYIYLAATAIVSVILVAKRKSAFSLIFAAAGFLTLPVTEKLTDKAFPFALAAALIIWLICGLRLVISYRKELTTSISGLSVKQAMDSINTAVLFCEKNGHIFLINHKMQELMFLTSGKVFRHGTLYIESVVVPNAEIYETDATNGKNYLYHVSDGSVWLFTVRDISVGRKTVIQLTATDVTDQDAANTLLKEKQIQLETQSRQLKDIIDNIEEIRHTEELVRAKTDIHDLMGQKLTLLLRPLRHGEWPTDNALSVIKEGLSYDIMKTTEPPKNPQTELHTVIKAFNRSGVKLTVTGKLPDDKDAALVMVQILREATANAVIHGYASEIRAEITHGETETKMCITNDCVLPHNPIKEGGGITGMRQRLAKIGGRLEIEASPDFMLTVTIPGKNN